jgi:Dolichyl-phosphate-mannose-protein mannosyltransferase
MARAYPSTGRLAGVLGVFFLAFYLLTSSGHFDSPDEELMFQVTRSLAERGNLAIQDERVDTPLVAAGVDGQAYAPYGLVPSAMSVPFYAAGRLAASLVAERYQGFLTRLFVATRDAVVSALSCVLVYLLGLRLGYRTRVAVALALGFGLATLAWPYARYAWSEPVTGLWLLLGVYAAGRSVERSSGRWSLLGGAALGLAVGTKVTTVVALPLVALYLACAGWRNRPWRDELRPLARRLGPFLAVFAVGAVAYGALNAVRFGDPLSTGYAAQVLFPDLSPAGLAGLLVSPGKSVFVYAPLALLGVAGWPLLAARRPWEAALFGLIVLSHVVLYGLLPIWHGDAAWGPRYLVPVLPLLVLPAGAPLAWGSAAAQRLGRLAFAALFTLGVLVNLGGALVDQRAYVWLLSRTVRDQGDRNRLRYWTPSGSPVLAQWNLFAGRLQRFASSWPQPFSLERGTYGPEEDPASPFPAWTTGATLFTVRVPDRPVVLRVRYGDRPSRLGAAPVTVLVNGTPVPPERVLHAGGGDRSVLETTINDPRVPLPVELRTDTWRPSQNDSRSRDWRDLGVSLREVTLEAGGHTFPAQASLLPELPVSDARPWGLEAMNWFYVPQTHLLDLWPWYWLLAGLPPAALAFELLLAIVMLGCAVWLGASLGVGALPIMSPTVPLRSAPTRAAER